MSAGQEWSRSPRPERSPSRPRQPSTRPARTAMHCSIRTWFAGLAATAAIALVLWAGLPVSAAPAAMTDTSHVVHLSATPDLDKRIAFRNAMGKYWEDHITWT